MLDYSKHTKSVGIDEVGRGPLAGPVVAACVYVPENVVLPTDLPTIKDSKKMTHRNRKKVVDWLSSQSDIKYSIGSSSVDEIDDINILQATFLAMQRAFDGIKQYIDTSVAVFVDGNRAPVLSPFNVETVVGGDDLVFSISLASIIAKEYRDEIMRKIDAEYPQYGFAKNVGYGTKQHIEAINKYGPTIYHRKSFEPIKGLLLTRSLVSVI